MLDLTPKDGGIHPLASILRTSTSVNSLGHAGPQFNVLEPNLLKGN